MSVCLINSRDDRAHKNVNYPIYNNYKQKLLDDIYDDGEERRKKERKQSKTFTFSGTHTTHNF